MNRYLVIAPIVVGLVVPSPAPATTIVLANPTFLVEPIVQSTDGRQISGSTPQALTMTRGPYSAGAITTALPDPSVSGFATGGAQAGPGVSGAATIDAFVQYNFEPVGPINVHVPVPLILSASGYATSSNTAGLGYEMVASVGLDGVGRIAAACVGQDPLHPTPPACSGIGGPTFSITHDFSQNSNTVGSVDIQIQGVIDNDPAVGARIGTITGFVDSVITIDPTFADASEFSLVVSPGIGDAPLVPAPEPSSLMLLGAAFMAARAVKRKAIFPNRTGSPKLAASENLGGVRSSIHLGCA